MSEKIIVDYYTDLLCVWAWIAQPRLDELQTHWGKEVSVRHRFVDIFGDSHRKIPKQWGEADGFKRFSDHVAHSAQPFEHCNIHPDVWTVVRPRSSAQAHLYLKAVESAIDPKTSQELALRIRIAFFTEARDISDLAVLHELASEAGADIEKIEGALTDGRAIAGLSTDLRSAADNGVRGSPTWLLNEGRQILYGNVGYRILSANIEELLRNPAEEASWC